MKRIIILIIIVVVIGLYFFFAGTDGTGVEEKIDDVQVDVRETLMIEQDLLPVELSEEEQNALIKEGIALPSEKEDTSVIDLQNVRSSDELGDIEADLNETDLSEVDTELDAIESDLLGL